MFSHPKMNDNTDIANNERDPINCLNVEMNNNLASNSESKFKNSENAVLR